MNCIVINVVSNLTFFYVTIWRATFWTKVFFPNTHFLSYNIVAQYLGLMEGELKEEKLEKRISK